MAIVNELITKFGFIGNLAPQETFNANLKASIGLLAGLEPLSPVRLRGCWLGDVCQSVY